MFAFYHSGSGCVDNLHHFPAARYLHSVYSHVLRKGK
jgi:hypothetical protein